MSRSRLSLLIDTDCGVDDALALLLALTDSHVDIKAITCVHGNTSIDNVWKNVFRVLKTCQQTQIPVFVGCDRNLVGSEANDENFHGSDGFGNVGHTIPVDDLKPQDEHASVALLRLVNEFPNEITVVALGPLTNLAVAQRMDSTFSGKIKQLYIMGGNIHGRGNIIASAEFNFYCDPEAAFVVLNEYTCLMTCIPWETCVDNRISWEAYYELVAMDTKNAKFVKNVTNDSIALLKQRKRTGYHCCDLFAMAVVLDEKIATEIIHHHATVEFRGKHTRGQMVVDKRPWSPLKPNLKIVTGVDEHLLVAMFKKMLT